MAEGEHEESEHGLHLHLGEGLGFLTHKLGPLPVWGWLLGAGAGIGVVLYIRARQGITSPAVAQSGVDTTSGNAGGSSGQDYGSAITAVGAQEQADVAALQKQEQSDVQSLAGAIQQQTSALSGIQNQTAQALNSLGSQFSGALSDLSGKVGSIQASYQPVTASSIPVSTPSGGGGSSKPSAQTAAENAYNAATGGAPMVPGTNYVQNNGNGTYSVVTGAVNGQGGSVQTFGY